MLWELQQPVCSLHPPPKWSINRRHSMQPFPSTGKNESLQHELWPQNSTYLLSRQEVYHKILPRPWPASDLSCWSYDKYITGKKKKENIFSPIALWFQRHPLQRNGETFHWNSLVPELWWNSGLSEQLHRGPEGLLHLFCGKDTDKATVSDQNTKSQVFRSTAYLKKEKKFFSYGKLCLCNPVVLPIISSTNNSTSSSNP